MKRASRGRRRRVALAFVGALAAGCLGKSAPPDRSYRLELSAPAPLAKPVLPGALEVERLRSDSVARRTALVYVSDAHARELRTRAYDHWADSPTLLLQREIAAWLRAAGFAERVVLPELGIAPDFRLQGELVRFEERRDPDAPGVVVELELTLTEPGRRAIRLQSRYREERAAEGPDAEAAVRAYEAALESLLARFVADAAAQR